MSCSHPDKKPCWGKLMVTSSFYVTRLQAPCFQCFLSDHVESNVPLQGSNTFTILCTLQ